MEGALRTKNSCNAPIWSRECKRWPHEPNHSFAYQKCCTLLLASVHWSAMMAERMEKRTIQTTFLLDLILLGGSFYLIYAIRSSFENSIQPLSFYLPFIIVSLVLFVGSGILFSLYSAHRVLFSLSYVSDFLRTFFLLAFCLVAFSFFTKTDYSRTIVLVYILSSFILLYLARFVLAWVIRTGGGPDTEVTNAAHGILTMVQVTPDP